MVSGLRTPVSLERIFLATALLGVGLGIVAALLYARAEPAAAVVVRLPGHLDPHPRFPAAGAEAPPAAPAPAATQETAALVVDTAASPAAELEGDGIGRVLAETAAGGSAAEPDLPPAPAQREPAPTPAAAEPPAPAAPAPETPATDQYGEAGAPAEGDGGKGDDGEAEGGGFEIVVPVPGAAP